MKRFQTLLSIFALFAFVAISTSAFAQENPNWDVAPSAKALAAASSAVYDQDYLNAVNSDAGADIIPSATARAAAKYYQYNEAKLAAGLEDGAEKPYFAAEHQSDNVKALVNHASSNAQIGQKG